MVSITKKKKKNETAGFAKAFFSGFTTVALVKIIHNLILNFKDLSGLYHVSSEGISKYDLLQIINKIYNKNIKIIRNEEFFMNRVLNSDNFRKKTKIKIPSWDDMIREMYEDYKINNFYEGSNAGE